MSDIPSGIRSQLTGLAGGLNGWRLTRWAALLPKIAALEPELQAARRRATPQAEPLAALPRQERRAARRGCWSKATPWSARPAGGRINMRHFDVQILGGIAMFHRSIVEMQTGEGKTLTATLPLYLHALMGKGCHLATVNDYLARRDAEWMRPIYEALGMTRRRDRDADVAAAAAQGLRLRHHLRHGQGVRLRFPPRPAAAAAHRRRADRPAGRHAGQGPAAAATKSPSSASPTSPWSTRPTAS